MRRGRHGSNQARAGWASRAGLVIAITLTLALTLISGSGHVADHASAQDVGAGRQSSPSQPAAAAANANASGNIPVVASPQFGLPGQTDVFRVAPNGAIEVRWVQGAGLWQGPLPISPPGLAPPGSQVAVSNQFGEPDQTDVFVVGNDGAVHVVWAVGAGGWGGPLPVSPPGLAVAGASVAVSNQFGEPDQTDVFVVGNDGAVHVVWAVGAGGWGGPLPVSPPGLAPPGSQVAVSNQFGEPDQTDVFVVGNDGAVHVVWAVGAGGWGGPLPVSPPGLAVAGASVAVSNQFGEPDQTDVFVVGNDGAVHVVWAVGAGGWGGPLPVSPPGLAVAGASVAVSNQFGEPDQTDVFVVGNDGAVHVVWAVGAGGWGGPLPVSPPGLAVAGASVAVSNQFGEPDQTDVFVVGNDGPVHVVWAVGAGAWGGPLAIFSAEQLAGQRVIYSYSGLTPPATLLQRISAGEAAGVIFFSQNIASDAQISAVIQELQSAETQSEVRAPLLMMTDQEGGEVRRLPGAPDLSEKEIGESANPPSEASQAGTGAGENLASVGMNVNLAPVLDVYRQAGDFIDQYQRSYSMDPQVVANLGQNFITAQQATGVAATGKHFPGLGAAATNQDTDVGPVTLNVPLSTLRSVDEVPYQSAITAGVKLVMVSWAVYPALDATLPAGLSPTVVQQELRGRLGFQGVTITDALEAGALEAYGSSAQRGVLAAQAGMDLLLCSEQDDEQGASTTDALATAYQDGSLNAGAFLASVQRVMALRASVR